MNSTWSVRPLRSSELGNSAARLFVQELSMKCRWNIGLGITLFAMLLLVPLRGAAQSAAGPSEIVSRGAVVGGTKLHYLTAGQGPSVVLLLHGYAETSRMWKPLIPLLAKKYRVIAPDLPGIGDSDIPANGLDMKDAAIRIHALAKSLGVEKARVV